MLAWTHGSHLFCRPWRLLAGHHLFRYSMKGCQDPTPWRKGAWLLEPLAPSPTVASARPGRIFTKRALAHVAATAARVMGRRGRPAAAREINRNSAGAICSSVSHNNTKETATHKGGQSDCGRQTGHAFARRPASGASGDRSAGGIWSSGGIWRSARPICSSEREHERTRGGTSRGATPSSAVN